MLRSVDAQTPSQEWCTLSCTGANGVHPQADPDKLANLGCVQSGGGSITCPFPCSTMKRAFGPGYVGKVVIPGDTLPLAMFSPRTETFIGYLTFGCPCGGECGGGLFSCTRQLYGQDGYPLPPLCEDGKRRWGDYRWIADTSIPTSIQFAPAPSFSSTTREVKFGHPYRLYTSSYFPPPLAMRMMSLRQSNCSNYPTNEDVVCLYDQNLDDRRNAHGRCWTCSPSDSEWVVVPYPEEGVDGGEGTLTYDASFLITVGKGQGTFLSWDPGAGNFDLVRDKAFATIFRIPSSPVGKSDSCAFVPTQPRADLVQVSTPQLHFNRPRNKRNATNTKKNGTPKRCHSHPSPPYPH